MDGQPSPPARLKGSHDDSADSARMTAKGLLFVEAPSAAAADGACAECTSTTSTAVVVAPSASPKIPAAILHDPNEDSLQGDLAATPIPPAPPKTTPTEERGCQSGAQNGATSCTATEHDDSRVEQGTASEHPQPESSSSPHHDPTTRRSMHMHLSQPDADVGSDSSGARRGDGDSPPPPEPPPSCPSLGRRPSTTRQFTEDFDPSSQDALYSSIPAPLRQGTPMLKVSAKKVARRMVKLKAEAGQVLWESKHAGMLNIENIRELRFGADARGFREQFKIGPECESRWITVIYTSSGKYKILHLVAPSQEIFKLWSDTLTVLFDQRKELLGGLDQSRKRQSIWLKQHWSNADLDNDQKLSYKDVLSMCRNLNITASEKDLQANFERADVQKRGFLDFADFQKFVKYLRQRPEIESIVRSIAGSSDCIPLEQFKEFMRNTQRSTLQTHAIEAVYFKFSDSVSPSQSVPPSANSLAPETDKLAQPAPPLDLRRATPVPGEVERGFRGRIMTVEGFTSFLLSSDNMAFDERQLQVCDDMTRPLCEYYISSSHNTYLVGGQLKGESTAEGYIRALQQGCRSVELDVWDGPDEPVVYHGRTLTSRLPVREALTAIAKYAFIASPYPLIMSMEVHCDQAQQDKLAEILKSTLGNALVDSPLFGETLEEIFRHSTQQHHVVSTTKVDSLPSPEELKYRILVKAKNLYVVKQAARAGEEVVMDSEESSSASSDSDLKKVFHTAMRIIRPNPSPPVAAPSLSPPASARTPSYNFNGSSGGSNAAPRGHSQSFGSVSSSSSTGPAPSERQQISNSYSVQPPLEGAASQSSSFLGGVQSMSPPTGSNNLTGHNRRISLSRMRSRSDRSDAGLNAPSAAGSAAPSSGSGSSSNKDKPLMSFALAGLIVYTVGVKWRGLNKKEQYAPSHVISLGERRANKIIKESRNDLISHNRSHLIRTYPAGTRFTSSNYLPYYFWAVGCSLVSLNFQTFDLGNEINSALFKKNGRAGYILKPAILREKDSNEKDKVALSKVEKYVLVLSILSAQQLPNPKGTIVEADGEVNLSQDSTTLVVKDKEPSKVIPVNSFVEVTVLTPSTPPSDQHKFRTGTVWGNGFNPVYPDGRFQIPFTSPFNDPGMLDLCFVRFEVMVRIGSDELSLGKYCVSLSCLMPGYRHIPLYDHLGQQYLFSSLFIYSQLEKQG